MAPLLQCSVICAQSRKMNTQPRKHTSRYQVLEIKRLNVSGHRLENKEPGGGLIFLMIYTNQICSTLHVKSSKKLFGLALLMFFSLIWTNLKSITILILFESLSTQPYQVFQKSCTTFPRSLEKSTA